MLYNDYSLQEGNKNLKEVEEMKKLLFVLSIVLVIGFFNGIESTYTRNAVVVGIRDNMVIYKDTCGYIWHYEGEGTIGEEVVLVMNDNHTSTIKDDTIKEIR